MQTYCQLVVGNIISHSDHLVHDHFYHFPHVRRCTGRVNAKEACVGIRVIVRGCTVQPMISTKLHFIVMFCSFKLVQSLDQ